MELHSLDNEILAAVVGLQERLAVHPVEEILLGQQGQSHVFHQLGQELDPLLRAGVDPRDDGLEYFLLAGHSDGVAGNELGHLVRLETDELVTLQNLREVSLYVVLGVEQELQAAVKVCEGPDAETVGGVELALEELAAGVSHVVELEEVGGREEGLDILLGDVHTAGVDIVHQDVESLGVHSLQDNPGAVSLSEACEHGVEVGRAGSQDNLNIKTEMRMLRGRWESMTNLLSWDLSAVRHQSDVTQET